MRGQRVEDRHVGAANGPLLQQVMHQPRRGIAAVIFRHRQDALVALGGLNHLLAALDGNGHGLFHHYVQPQIERLADHGVMHRWVHHDIYGH